MLSRVNIRIAAVLFFVFPLFTEAQNLVLEEYDVSSFPKVELKLRTNRGSALDREILRLSEWKGQRTRRIGNADLHRPEGTRPIHIYLLVQMTDSLTQNMQGTEILKSIVEASDPEDRFSFVFWTDDVFIPKLDLGKTESLKQANIPGGSSNKNTPANLDFLFQKISSQISETDYVLLLFYDRDMIPSPDAQNGEYLRRIPLNVLAFPSVGSKFLAKKYSGQFHSLASSDLRSQVLADLEYFRKKPWSLTYDSPFQEEWQWEGNGSVQVELESQTSGRIRLEYEIPWGTRLRIFLLHPSIFLPTVSLLVILTLAGFLIVLRKGNGKKQEGSVSPEERLHAIEDEQDAYRKMYGNQYQLVYSDEDRIETERSAPIALKEFEEGEAYEKATLVLKEGRNPGKQYSLQRSETTIGNSDLCDLVLYEQAVSKSHARIRKVRNRYVLYDLVSDAGTFLNGKKVLRPRVLYDFDEIGIGKALLVFRGK
ncbi:FHA domain-containing protein [Leptospira wolffii]|uniref:FHA domain-containing protein n=1 Tax=Leptospira wolffii TaxID=409998 RepID=UPI00031860E8|nr:FHA domain-containing protein [Leptospira wolffii]EPG66834.1 FHA domain protein [Leptospira wolffii serovar Khorat str. Khorat-H2]